MNHLKQIINPLRTIERIKTHLITQALDNNTDKISITTKALSEAVGSPERMTRERLKALEASGFITIYPQQSGLFIKINYLEQRKIKESIEV